MPPPYIDRSPSLSVGVGLAQSSVTVQQSKARTVTAVSVTKTCPLATVGAAKKRAVNELHRAAWTEKALVNDETSASWPIDLLALPPDCVQSLFAVAAGRLIGSD